MTFFLLTIALAATSTHATLLRGAPEKGVGSVEDFATLLPFHPGGQSQSVVKARCINFVNHLLEKSAYSPDAVGDIMPKCVWKKEECAELKKDLLTRLAKKASLLQDPMGPAPAFATKGGLDDSVYGWCDTMETMIKKQSVKAIIKQEKEQIKAEAAAKKAAEEAAKKAKAKKAAAEKKAKKDAEEKKKKVAEVEEKKEAVKKAVQDVKKAVDKASKETKKEEKKEEKKKKAMLMEEKDDEDDKDDDKDDDEDEDDKDDKEDEEKTSFLQTSKDDGDEGEAEDGEGEGEGEGEEGEEADASE